YLRLPPPVLPGSAFAPPFVVSARSESPPARKSGWHGGVQLGQPQKAWGDFFSCPDQYGIPPSARTSALLAGGAYPSLPWGSACPRPAEAGTGAKNAVPHHCLGRVRRELPDC